VDREQLMMYDARMNPLAELAALEATARTWNFRMPLLDEPIEEYAVALAEHIASVHQGRRAEPAH
jgi:hypothetical protein